MTKVDKVSHSSTILAGPTLRAAQLAWLVVVLAVIGLLMIGLPALHRQLSTICDTPVFICEELGRPTAEQAGQLMSAGFTLDLYATFIVAAELLMLIVWISIGTLIFLLRRNDWMAMLVSLMLVVFSSGTFISGAFSAAAVDFPMLSVPIALLSILGELLIAAFFLLFPNGRPIPRWLWWVIPFRGVAAALEYAPAYNNLPQADILSTIFLLPVVVLFVGVQVYRYRRHSTQRERYQTRWVVFGVVVGLGTFVVLAIVAMVTGFWQSIWSILAWTFMNIIATIIPITFAIAILRSNLWDIDVVIRRTTVYAVLTSLLALVYFGSVIVLQRLLSPIAGESTAAVVLSTLLIAALFLPLRRRVQDTIDRRFFRQKYDAEKVLSQFAATVRDETDLEALTAELVRVIQETMQPEHVSIWLKPDVSRGKAAWVDLSERHRADEGAV
jgi:hypothetical protein